MNNRKRLTLGAVAAAATLTAAVGVAGVVTTLTPASAEVAEPRGSGTTLVTFTEGAVAALGPLSPSGAKPGAFGLSASGLSVEGAFPIVGGSEGGRVDHAGGLTLTDGTNILTLRNYAIDTEAGVLSAGGLANGSKLSRVEFLDLAPAPAQQGCAATATLTLAKPAADAIAFLFGTPDLTGAAIGTACVDPR